jgi:dolichyl-phosphate beta-glucosyltransferase
MDFSIVIPVLNEEFKVKNDIIAADYFLNSNHYQGEIIISDDGSSDKTVEICKSMVNNVAHNLIILEAGRHNGKGSAVRRGILASSGNMVLFMDSGLNIPVDQAKRGIEIIESGNIDMAIASRHLPESIIHIPLVWHRRVFSYLFRKVAKIYLPIPEYLTDTQCGFKLFKGDIARDLFSKAIIDGFLFDIEIILLADRQGYKISEFPVDWTCDRDTRLRVKSTFVSTIKELRKIKNIVKKINNF